MKSFNSFFVGMLCLYTMLTFPVLTKATNLADPVISPDPTSLNGLSYYFGDGPSPSAFFTIEATDLQGSITVSPPAGFEISRNDNTFQTDEISISMTASNKTVYVRLVQGLEIASYTGIITLSSTNAPDAQVQISGEVWNTSDWDYLEDFRNANLDGSYETSAYIGNRGLTWQYTDARDEGGSTYNDSVYGKAIKLKSATNLKGTVYSENIPNGIKDFSCKLFRGTSSAPRPKIILYIKHPSNDENAEYVAIEDFVWSEITNDEYLYTAKNIDIEGNFNSKIINDVSGAVIVDDIAWTSYSVTNEPTISTNTDTLDTFSYPYGSTSSESQCLTLSGENITNQIIVTPPSNYEISLDNSVFMDNLNLLPSNASVGNKNIYIRLKLDLSEGIYKGNIDLSSIGANSRSVFCEGAVSPLPLTPLMINEVDADTRNFEGDSDNDEYEFIELYTGSTGVKSLNNYVVVLYRSSDNTIYDNFGLEGYSSNEDGYFVIGNTIVPNVNLTKNDGFLQNGADAVALYYGEESDFTNEAPNNKITKLNLVDALVYGSTYAPELMQLLNKDQPIIDEDADTKSDKRDDSMGRIPNGEGGLRNTMTYAPCFPSPGVANYSRLSVPVTNQANVTQHNYIYGYNKTIHITSEFQGMVFIYNIQGGLIKTETKTNTEIKIPLKPGIYIVKLATPNQISIKKVILN